MRQAVGKGSVFLAEEIMTRIEENIYQQVEMFQMHTKSIILKKSLSASNQAFERLDNIQRYIQQRDKEWVSAPKDKVTPFMQPLINNELSDNLRERFIEFGEKEYGYRVFCEIIVTNRYGANVAQTEKTTDYNQADEKWWQKTKEDGFYVGAIEFDESAGVIVIPLGVRIDDQEGNFIGVIKILYSIRSVFGPIEFMTKKYETTEVNLITKDGKLIYSTKPFKMLEDISEKEFFKKIKGESDYFVAKEGGREMLFSYAKTRGYRNLGEIQWILVVGHNVKEVLQPISTLRNRLFAGFFVVILIGIIAGFTISLSITKPIKRLIKGAEIIGKGNLTYKIDISKDEIGEVATAFNKMADDLKEHRDHLEELVAERTKQLKEAEGKLIQSEKLAAVAQIASEAAHEIKNPLAVIKAGIYGLNLILPAEQEDAQNMLQPMDKAVSRAVSYLDNLLNLGRPPRLNLIPIKVNEVIEETLKEIPKDLLADIQIDKDFEADLPLVQADPERLKQVFLNLIKNAAEAIGQGSGDRGQGLGRIEIKSEKKGEFVKISISDTGKGIAEKDLLHIFDPFFTTKGKGTGLGMCICERIIEAHKGEIEVTSQPGQGTTVVVKIRV